MRKRYHEWELYHTRTVLRPPPDLSARFDAIIDRAIAAGPNTKIDYQLDSAKANFLNYVCDWRGLVAHGSPLPELVRLVPNHKPDRDVNEFGRRDLTFASPDALWAMWFALLPAPPRSINCERLPSHRRCARRHQEVLFLRPTG